MAVFKRINYIYSRITTHINQIKSSRFSLPDCSVNLVSCFCCLCFVCNSSDSSRYFLNWDLSPICQFFCVRDCFQCQYKCKSQRTWTDLPARHILSIIKINPTHLQLLRLNHFAMHLKRWEQCNVLNTKSSVKLPLELPITNC